MTTHKDAEERVITCVGFSEFCTASNKTKVRLGKSPTEKLTLNRGKRAMVIRAKRTRGLSLSVLERKVRCLNCGDVYNGSTAPVEPHKFCSKTCEEMTVEDSQ